MAHPIEIILTRRLGELLSVPPFLVDPKGNLLFYNEPAETVLGQRFDETGPMPADTWATAFNPIDDQGQPISPQALPLMITLGEARPAYKRFFIHGLDGTLRQIEVASIPITGLKGKLLGAAALFWELPD